MMGNLFEVSGLVFNFLYFMGECGLGGKVGVLAVWG